MKSLSEVSYPFDITMPTSERLDCLEQLIQSINRGVLNDHLFQEIYDRLSTILEIDIYYIGLFHPGKKNLSLDFVISDHCRRPRVSLPTEYTFLSEVIAMKRTILIPNKDDYCVVPANPGKNHRFPGKKAQSALAAPLVSQNEVLGVICIQSYREDTYDDEDAKLLSTLACCLASELNNSKISREKQELQSNFNLAEKIAHEVNQPLTGIIGYCALMTEDMSEDHPLYDDMNEIKNQSYRLEALIRNFQQIIKG